MAISSCAFPPLFVWTVAQSGEDLAAGFQRAAELYQARAVYRSELFLYSVLPCSVLSLAAMIIVQILPVFITLIAFLNAISGS
jgi:type II secretory pathway component PulF